MEKRNIQTRRVLSLSERIEVIQIAETFRDTRELARRFECGRTQILSILQQKDRLLKEWANNGDPKRLRRRPSVYAVAINKMVAEWINRARSAQMSLTDNMIIDKACQGKKFFKYVEFRPNRRWLDRFKRRFRLENTDLETPDPSFKDGVGRSLKFTDIYEDIKETMDPEIIETMTNRLLSIGYNYELCPEISQTSQTISSNNDEMEDSIDVDVDVEVDEKLWQFDNTCETEMSSEEPLDTIEDDEKALTYLKKLEEYSMLKDNYRAIGLIMQLEQLFKGELEG